MRRVEQGDPVRLMPDDTTKKMRAGGDIGALVRFVIVHIIEKLDVVFDAFDRERELFVATKRDDKRRVHLRRRR